MATSYSSSSFISLLAIFFMYLTLICSAYRNPSSTPTIASAQIKFWSKNVENQMPNPILNKLSPLTQKDTDFFIKSISNNKTFSADDNFCSLAKLACKSIDITAQLANGYEKAYSINPAPLKIKTNSDPFSFFRLSLLKKGNIIHLPNMEQPFPNRAFLPPEIASKISLSSIKDIAQIFPQSVVNQAGKDTIGTTLSYCNSEAIKGEIKSCPTSLEEMISFSKIALGGNKLISLSSENIKFSNAEVIVKNVKKFATDKIVACHEVFLPYATYFCHSLSSTNLYAVDMVEKKTGAPVNSMLATCHMDTSPWPASHVAFEILKFGPGQGEACHWFTQIDLAWIVADGESV